ncbi:putative hemoglobin and hemoglobin-haptoglobin-binding protein 1 precursor, partial [Haemophilus influenzae]
LMFQEVQKQLM